MLHVFGLSRTQRQRRGALLKRRRQAGFLRLSMLMPRWGSARNFSPQDLFRASEPGAHFEAYNPASLLARRNQLTWSSQFSNAAWARTNILSVTENADGTGDLVVPDTTATALHRVTQAVCNAGVYNTVSVRAKFSGFTYLAVQVGGGGIVWFNLSTGVVTMSGAATGTMTAVVGLSGYYDCVYSDIATGTTLSLYCTNSNSSVNATGDGTSGIYLARAQLEWNTTTASAYQDVTDWNTEYLAAAGSAAVGMWQDSAGTTPVTAVEQPVGKWMDWKGTKGAAGNHATQATSGQRPLLSARVNLAVKSEQLDDTTSWVRSGLTTVTANAFGTLDKLVGDATVAEHKVTQNVTLVSGVTYRIRLRAKAGEITTISFYGAGGLSTGSTVVADLSAGTVSGGTNAKITAVGDGSYIISTDATSSFTGSNALAIRTGNATVAGDGVSGLYVGGVDLRTSDDAAKNIPAYQRVNTSSDYDTAGFPHYLKFDGIDDFLQTPSVDFSGVGKVSVWAGATKLSDAASGILVELTASTATTAGSFAMFAPSGTAANLGFRSRGSVLGTDATSASTKAAPYSAVMTGLGDIANDAQELRLNAVSAATSSTDQGTGNFTNAALYIARRGGSTLPFNGRIYSLTMRGSTTPTSEGFITKMNRYAANLLAITI